MGRSNLLQTLDNQVLDFKAQAFSVNTKKTYNSQLRLYVEFCKEANIAPVPISQRDLLCYLAYLANKLSFNSIKQYVNIVRLMHLEAGFPNPLENFPQLTLVQRGIQRVLGSNSSRKLPITFSILQQIFHLLDFHSSFDLTFWAVCLVAFFSFLRKSNLLVSTANSFNPDIHLTISDLTFTPTALLLKVRHAKTIQYSDRVFTAIVPHIPNSPFCPALATMLVVQKYQASPYQPVFVYSCPTGTKPLCYPAFLSKLRQCLSQLGYNPTHYAAHSFRRGGASLALERGLPPDMIQLHGDWRSYTSYQRYLSPSMTSRLEFVHKLATGI
jgi:hypothetical protein